jgi:hypothetical protein
MFKNQKGCGSWAGYAITFGVGLVLSSFCPTGLMLFIVAVIMVLLGIALFKKC